MNTRVRNAFLAAVVGAALLLPAARIRAAQEHHRIPNLAGYPDSSGVVQTFSTEGGIDQANPFFQVLGTNGRSCATCHQPGDAMSVSAAHARMRFDASLGLDPLFRPVDGANCDHDIDLTTIAGRSAAYSLARSRALIRVALPVPAARDFEITSVSNPYGCSETAVLSMYRRPLPAAQLRFLTAVMWDGRESAAQTGTTPITSANYPQALRDDLAHQAMDATLGHAEGAAPGPTPAQQNAIVSFEMALSSAQAMDREAGSLASGGASGGPEPLSRLSFFVGVNDPVGLNPANPVPFSFSTRVFDLFDSWEHAGDPERRAIARGQALFNSKTFTISGVAGLNGATFPNGVTAPESVVSTCGICHDTPNAGNHSVAAPLNIGTADPPGGLNPLDTSYLPVITICRKPDLAVCVRTTDPGRALITGAFADVGKFKGPVLRGLAARAPYFHNGSAQTLEDVIAFYDTRFHIELTPQEKSDLVAFLRSL